MPFLKRSLFFILCLTSLMVGAHGENGNAEAGQTKASLCVGCHGVNGNSVIPTYPKLAGQQERYLTKQLKALKDKESGRTDPIMSPIAQMLSDQDILDLSVYYTAQKRSIGEAQNVFLSLGRRIYLGGDPKKGIPACSGCHAPDGHGNNLAAFPSLSGQHLDYTIKQMNQFRAQERKNDFNILMGRREPGIKNGENKIMRTIAAKMTDLEIEAVAQYVYGLQGEGD